MADREIDLKFVLDDSGAIKSINGVDKAIKEVNEEAAAAGKAFGDHLGLAAAQVFSGIKKGAALSAAALTAMGVAAASALNLAREVEDLAGGFETLSDRVGNISGDKLDRLKEATQGLTTEMDIMRSANQAVLLGVDDGSGKFEEMAASAVKLGNAMGITTTEALNSLVLGIGRQSKMILDNLGIMVNLETAYKNFAEANGLVANSLTESQKKLAFQQEAFRQIKEGADSLPPSAETAANAYERLTATIADSRGHFALGVSSSDDLKEALQGFNTALNEIDFNKLGKEFGDFVSEMVNYATLISLNFEDMILEAKVFAARYRAAWNPFASPDAAEAMVRGNAALQKQVDGMLDFTNAKERLNELGMVVDATFNDITASSTREIEKLQSSLTNIRGELADSGVAIDPATIAQFQDLSAKLEDLKGKVPEVKKANVDLSGSLDEAGKSAKKAASDFERFTQQISEISNTKAGGVFEQVAKDAQVFGVALATNSISIKDFNEQLALLGKKTGKDGFKVIIDGAKAGDKAVSEVNAQVEKLLNNVKGFNAYEKPVEEVFKEFRAGKLDVQAVEEQIQLLILSTGGSIAEIEKLKKALEKLPDAAGPNSGGLFGSGFFAQPDANQLKGFKEELESQMATGISNAVTAALEGGDVRGALEDFGQSVGGVLGNAMGGPEGAIVGSFLGKFVSKELMEFGKSTKDSAEVLGANLGLAVAGPFGGALGFALGGLFGGMSKDEKLRRAFGDGFNKLIKEANIDILKELDTDDIQQKFKDLDLDGALQPQFDGIAAALATTFGLLEEGGDNLLSQFSQILAVNFQNAEGLNDLQIILQRAGLSAEQLKEQLEEAYLSGGIAAGEFLNASSQVDNLFTQGIPGAIGATDVAFQNFVDNALRSGADAKDGIGDLGAEMTEALNGGVSTLAELQERLIAQGADASKVAAFFEAAAKAGISTIEQLTNVTTAQAANITAQLTAVSGFFSEASNEVERLEEMMNRLNNKEINIKVKYSSEYDSQSTKDVVEGGTGSTGLGAG